MSSGKSCNPGREALAVDTLRQRGRVLLRVTGESMLPTLWPGDLVEVATSPLQDAHQGDIVLAVRDGRLYLHRFIARAGADGFVVRGDSMPQPDPVHKSDAFLGRIEGVVRDGRLVSSSSNLPFHSRALGLLYCYSSPARRLALTLHRRQSSRGSNYPIAPESVEG